MQCFTDTAHLENAKSIHKQGDHTAGLPGTVLIHTRHSGSMRISPRVHSQEGPNWNAKAYGHLQCANPNPTTRPAPSLFSVSMSLFLFCRWVQSTPFYAVVTICLESFHSYHIPSIIANSLFNLQNPTQSAHFLPKETTQTSFLWTDSSLINLSEFLASQRLAHWIQNL